MVSGRVLRRLVAVGVVVLAVAAACSSSAAASAQDVVLGTAQRTLTERTAQVAVVVGFDGPVAVVVGAASGQSFDGTGAIDFRARRSQVSLNLPSNLAGGGLLQGVVDNNALLLNLPGLAQSLPGLKPWTQSNPADPAQQQALGVLNQLLLILDPVTAIEALYGAGARTTKVGTETIRGAATTHYRTTVDLKAAAAKLSGAARAEYERAISALGQTSVPVDVWVDAQRRARRIQVGIDLANAGGKITATLELFDYGSPVTITVPPPDQIATPSPTTNSTPPGTRYTGGGPDQFFREGAEPSSGTTPSIDLYVSCRRTICTLNAGLNTGTVRGSTKGGFHLSASFADPGCPVPRTDTETVNLAASGAIHLTSGTYPRELTGTLKESSPHAGGFPERTICFAATDTFRGTWHITP